MSVSRTFLFLDLAWNMLDTFIYIHRLVLLEYWDATHTSQSVHKLGIYTGIIGFFSETNTLRRNDTLTTFW